ncbi:MAG: TrmH family RNA methyltransferase [Oscillospiraceae bacterium]
MHPAITSRANERVKHARCLATSAAQRAEEGLLFAEGLRLCLDLAQRLRARAAFFTQAMVGAHPEVAQLAPEAYLVSDGVAQKLGDTQTPQGLFCLFEMPPLGLPAISAAGGVLLCEQMADPANVGTLVRSAAGLGLGGVVFTPGSADVFSPKALRASMGAVGRVPLAVCPLDEALAHLRAAGATVYAAALEGARPFYEVRAGGAFALMVGNEGAGLSAGALAAADERLCIPMHGGVESLNAAAAATALMSYLKHPQA